MAMATCAELRAQLRALERELVDLTSEVDTAKGDLAELESESSVVNPKIIEAARSQLRQAEADRASALAQVRALRDEMQATGCFIQPQQILDIQFANPTSLRTVDALFAQGVAFGQQDPSTILGGTFPSRDAEKEWKQTLPASLADTAGHEADHEGQNLVGAVGWALVPEFSGGDVPFMHPFGFDWEFMFALDQPPSDPSRYTFLLTTASQSCSDGAYGRAVQQAADAKDAQGRPIIPPGPDGLPSLLGVEMDGGLIPEQFSDRVKGGVEIGDRIAVFGRWIVDCGHQIPITTCDGVDLHPGLTAFRTEIHPPLLMATARVTEAGQAEPPVLNAPRMTRVLVTSRPYLVGQRFTTDTDQIHSDTGSDDGPFLGHIIKEVVKVHENILGIPTASLMVEAHPKIKSYPFTGMHEMRLTVRPPDPGAGGTLTVAYQFTVRTACSVQVVANGPDAVDVVIRLDQNGYQPPPLPARTERTWTRDQLAAMNPDAAGGILTLEALTAALHALTGDLIGAGVATAILERGILTDEYATEDMRATNLLDSSRATSAAVSGLPPLDGFSRLQELLARHASLISDIQTDTMDLQELQSESTHVNPKMIQRIQARIAANQAELNQVDQEIAALQNFTNSGIGLDDGQPFPIVGWLEIGYVA
jgi:hypothetical protein